VIYSPFEDYCVAFHLLPLTHIFLILVILDRRKLISWRIYTFVDDEGPLSLDFADSTNIDLGDSSPEKLLLPFRIVCKKLPSKWIATTWLLIIDDPLVFPSKKPLDYIFLSSLLLCLLVDIATNRISLKAHTFLC